MLRKSCSAGTRCSRRDSFSLIELLVVMSIIAVLAALTIGAAVGVISHAARSRASSEIHAMATGLDSYKVDNGGYPVSDGNLLTNNYINSDGSGAEYQANSEILYQALSGKTNFSDTTMGRAYMNFKNSQVGSGAGGTYVMDPWGLSYAYSSGSAIGAGTPSQPYSGSNQYDLWSTGGVTQAKLNMAGNGYLTNAWICNWQGQ